MFVSYKDGEGAKVLENLHSEKLKVVQLNLCKEEQITQAVEFVKANLEDPEKGDGLSFRPRDRVDGIRWRNEIFCSYLVQVCGLL